MVCAWQSSVLTYRTHQLEEHVNDLPVSGNAQFLKLCSLRSISLPKPSRLINIFVDSPSL